MARVNPAKVATPSEFLKTRANVMALPSCSAFVYPVLRSNADFAESKDEFQPGWEKPGSSAQLIRHEFVAFVAK